MKSLRDTFLNSRTINRALRVQYALQFNKISIWAMYIFFEKVEKALKTFNMENNALVGFLKAKQNNLTYWVGYFQSFLSFN